MLLLKNKRALVLFVSFQLFLFAYRPAHSEVINLGFQDFSREINWLDSNTPIGLFVRSAISKTLVVPAKQESAADFALSLSDNLLVSADRKYWSFKVPDEVRFHSGGLLTLADVRYSLERCQASGLLQELETINTRRVRNGARIESWIDLKLKESEKVTTSGVGKSSNQKRFPLSLANCPIIEQGSSELFGANLGKGTNVVSLGSYEFSDVALGREVILTRFQDASFPKGLKQEISLRAFKDPLHGLTALRSGSIDALIGVSDSQILERAAADETLLISKCRVYMVIQRRGLRMQCEPTIDLTALQYGSY